MTQVRIGLDVWQQSIAMDDLRECWTMADEGGVDNLWLCDHFQGFRGENPKSNDIFEAWTTLAAMAVLTKRARIGVMVTGNTYRHPAVLAKMATTVDHLSHGRLEFGLGAADAPWEHEMYGMPFPETGDRLRMMREAFVLIKKLWTEDVSNLDGRYYKLTDAVSHPNPMQKPYPPIWIGGEGEKVTLKIVAEHADVWNAIGRKTVEEFRHKMNVLGEHCRTLGRDPSEIRRSVQVHYEADGDIDAISSRVEELIAGGFSDFIILVPAPEPRPRIEKMLKTLLPRFQGASVPVGA